MVTQNKQAHAKGTHRGRQQNESCEWRSSIGAMHKAMKTWAHRNSLTRTAGGVGCRYAIIWGYNVGSKHQAHLLRLTKKSCFIKS